MSSSDADPASVWHEEIDRLVDESLASGSATAFAELLEELPSIDPLTVWESLERRLPSAQRAGRFPLPAHDDVTPSPLPIAHPLNFDWRYSEATNNALIERLARSTARGDAIGYLGAPTTWRAARERLPDRRHVLLDRDAARYVDVGGEAHTVTVGRDPLPAICLAAAVVDPPWYPEHHAAFLAAASGLLAANGIVYASFPPRLTRPGVLAERANIVQNAVRAGLVVEDESPLALRYETPPFEAAAFSAAGLPTVPRAWRRGDLLTFQKHGVGEVTVPALPDEGWMFVTIDEIPLAVRPTDASTEALLEPAIVGATLPTVSRRHPARARAALWSSRNRIYDSREPALLTAVAVELAEDADLETGADPKQENVVALAKEIRNLVRLERKEHGLD